MQFGRYREDKTLIDEDMQKHFLLQPSGSCILTDFTGEGYLKKELRGSEWKEWYENFKTLMRYSEREILKR